tara:strand:+ start:105 stop:1097 length:993 start_codon:yes stop_codon:yes gene_type:complete
MEHIPEIDLSPYISGDLNKKKFVADQIDLACQNIGFFTIKGHGISQALIDQTMKSADEFFSLPESQKLKIRQPAKHISRGYTPFAAEQLAAGLGNSAPPDLKEMIDIGPIDIPDNPYFSKPEARDHFHPNLWPDQPFGFRKIMETYYKEMNLLADLLMEIFSLSLNLNFDFFKDKLDKNISALRLICYPNQSTRPKDGQLRTGEHTDYGTLTILYASGAPGGLQVLNKNNQWVDVKPKPGTFIINIADAMQVWTNDKWRSTLHRVVNPPKEVAQNSRRISLPFFHQPNYDAIISPLASCIDKTETAKYEAITFGDHWMKKWMASRDTKAS